MGNKSMKCCGRHYCMTPKSFQNLLLHLFERVFCDIRTLAKVIVLVAVGKTDGVTHQSKDMKLDQTFKLLSVLRLFSINIFYRQFKYKSLHHIVLLLFMCSSHRLNYHGLLIILTILMVGGEFASSSSAYLFFHPQCPVFCRV